jgi:hypothetical protein
VSNVLGQEHRRHAARADLALDPVLVGERKDESLKPIRDRVVGA